MEIQLESKDPLTPLELDISRAGAPTVTAKTFAQMIQDGGGVGKVKLSIGPQVMAQLESLKLSPEQVAKMIEEMVVQASEEIATELSGKETNLRITNFAQIPKPQHDQATVTSINCNASSAQPTEAR